MPTAKVLTRFQQWLLGADDAPNGPHRPATSAESHRAADDAERRRLEARLCGILQEQPTVTAGRIFLIDLTELRQELAEQWLTHGELIDSLARRVFRRNLTAQDAYCRHGDDGFLVVFGSLSVAAAEVVCRRIADELRAMLLGKTDGAPVAVRSVVGQSDSRLLLEEITLAAKTVPVAPTPPQPRPGELAAPLRQRREPAGARAEMVEVLDPGWDAQPGTADPQTDMQAQDGSRRPAPQLVGEDEPGWERLDVERPDPPRRAHAVSFEPEDGSGPPTYLFQPVWDTKSNLLSTYLCLTPDEIASEPTCMAAAADPDMIDGDAVAAFDLSRLLSAADMLDELVRNCFQLFINTAVHAETMGSPRSRRQYLHVLRRIPENLQKFLIVQIYGLPSGVPTGRIVECVTALRPYCGAVLVETGLNPGELSKYAGVGVHSVGFDLRTVPPSASKLIGELTKFAAEAHRHKLWSFATGLTNSTQAAVSMTAGIRYLGGPRVGPAGEVPMHIRRFTLMDFYRSAPESNGELGPRARRLG